METRGFGILVGLSDIARKKLIFVERLSREIVVIFNDNKMCYQTVDENF